MAVSERKFNAMRLLHRHCWLQGYPEEGVDGPLTLQLLEGDPTQMELLEQAGVPFSDTIIIGGTLSGRSAKEADALTLASLMLVQECLGGSGRDTAQPAHIVGMVRCPQDPKTHLPASCEKLCLALRKETLPAFCPYGHCAIAHTCLSSDQRPPLGESLLR